MDDITKDEKEIVDELRRRTINDTTPKMLEDVSLFYRFAKARDFNLVEAEVMLRKHMAWRKEMQINTILTDYKPPEVLVKYVATSFVCFDKEGSIVRYIDCGRMDINGLWSVATKAEMAKYAAYLIEKDKEILIKKGQNLGKLMYTAIHDYENMSYGNAISLKTVQYMIYLLKMFIDNYPETIRCLMIINAPFYCTMLFSTVKKIIPQKVLQKIQVHGPDGWKEKLLELIDSDGLPAYLGGTRTDPDGNPLCETFIPRGRPIPKSYYMNKRNRRLSLATDAEKLIVKPLSKEEICLDVKEDNSYLELEVEIKNRDIGFSLKFKDGTSEDFQPVVIIPMQSIDASDGPEKNCFKCEKAGIYTIVFDNSYSWFHSKEVFYRVKIKGPGNDETCRLT
ncbi:unnamed protein product [Larinioides sclopetarius]|uniref:SEC14-like protein 2 n=1 Tax=Larinioides sclopetarius TaxID=280406 RepID=A0AAV2A4P0_9ARAC